MGIFDRAREQAEKLMEEHGDGIQQPSDPAFDRNAADASERAGGTYTDHADPTRDTADAHVGTAEDAAVPADPAERVTPPAQR